MRKLATSAAAVAFLLSGGFATAAEGQQTMEGTIDSVTIWQNAEAITLEGGERFFLPVQLDAQDFEPGQVVRVTFDELYGEKTLLDVELVELATAPNPDEDIRM